MRAFELWAFGNWQENQATMIDKSSRLGIISSHFLPSLLSPPLSSSSSSRSSPYVNRFLSSQLGLNRIAFSTHNNNPHKLISMPASSEKEAALSAASAPVSSDSPTIFDKIINKEIPSKIVFEDDKVLAFRDISPQAPTHILIIPKVKDGLPGLSKAEERHCEILGRLLYTAKVVAKQEGLDDGFRIVINDGPSGCQSVYHLHVHLLGGRQMNWPPG